MQDFAPGAVLDFKFTTIDADGVASSLSSGAAAVYKDNSTTESTSGVTLSADFDGKTGLNNIRIDTSSDGTFYAAGSSFTAVLTAGTVDGSSVISYVIGHFSLGRGAGYARMGAPAGASMSADLAAVRARLSTTATKTGAVVADGANSATVFVTDLTEATTDHYKDALLKITSGTLAEQVKKITAYNGTTKAVTVQGGFTGTPANGVTFEILND